MATVAPLLWMCPGPTVQEGVSAYLTNPKKILPDMGADLHNVSPEHTFAYLTEAYQGTRAIDAYSAGHRLVYRW